MTDGKHSILLFKPFIVSFLEGLSVFWYNKEALNYFFLFFTTSCSQRSKIPFCPHYSRNWTVTSPNFPSPLVFRHSYRNIIDFSWHLQSMSICLVMAVNICFDAALDPAAQGSSHENRFSKSAEHLLVNVQKYCSFRGTVDIKSITVLLILILYEILIGTDLFI